MKKNKTPCLIFSEIMPKNQRMSCPFFWGPYIDKSIAKNAWTLVRHASDNEGTLGRDPIMQRERDLIKGNNAL
mgnify:FL=1